ncbi:MAG TPA: MSMEG_4193 family putative phosphomutase [Acidimicrobiales bacterium]|nr:MSMEG_4193 family putative phosphomutase [Acidimicrobiales bacterium]
MPTGQRSRRRAPQVPPTTVVVMVRHGATPTTGTVLPGRARGLHLSDAGRAQAQATADRLAGTGAFAAVYSSPLERARETAAPIAKALGLKVTVERGLLECDFGEWTGAELKTLFKKPEWRTVQRWPSGFRFPGGESFPEMQTRMVDTLARLRERHRGGRIVVVSHADPIKAALADALGTPLDLFQRIVISPASVSSVAYGDTGPTVLAVNSVGPQQELHPS